MLFVRTSDTTFKDENGRGPLGTVFFIDPIDNLRSHITEVTLEEAKDSCPLLEIYDWDTHRHVRSILQEIYEKHGRSRNNS